MITENPELSEVFPEPPMAALRQGPNLRKLLCRAKLTKVTRNRPRATHRSSAGWKRCSSSGGNPCNQCPYTPISATSITSHITGYTHYISSAINCKTENLIYAYKCKKCPVNFSINTSKRAPKKPVHRGIIATNYIGKSKRKFNKRLYEHLYYVTSKKMDEPSAQHFCQAGHNGHDLIALGLEHVRSKDPFVLRAREHLLIKKFDSFRNGLNQEPWTLTSHLGFNIFPLFIKITFRSFWINKTETFYAFIMLWTWKPDFPKILSNCYLLLWNCRKSFVRHLT